MDEVTIKGISTLSDALRDPVLAVSDGRIKYANAAAARCFGRKLVGEAAEKLFSEPFPDDRDSVALPIEVGDEVFRAIAVKKDGLWLVSVPENAPYPIPAPIVFQMRSVLFNMRLCIDRLFSPDFGGSVEENILVHSYYSLLHLTEQMQDVNDISENALICRKRATELSKLVWETVDSVNYHVEKKRKPIECHGGERLCMSYSDPDRIEQLLMIVLTNALQHTAADARISVTLRRKGGRAIISIDDAGEGIPADRLPDVFAMRHFDPLKPMGGAGLGLLVADGIARAHGGSIMLESRENAGTRVRISLPCTDSVPVADGDIPPYRSPRRLLCELSPVLDHTSYSKLFRD